MTTDVKGIFCLTKNVHRRKSLLSRKLAVKNTDPCGDVLLDEALKHMKETEYSESIQVSRKLLNVNSL